MADLRPVVVTPLPVLEWAWRREPQAALAPRVALLSGQQRAVARLLEQQAFAGAQGVSQEHYQALDARQAQPRPELPEQSDAVAQSSA